MTVNFKTYNPHDCPDCGLGTRGGPHWCEKSNVEKKMSSITSKDIQFSLGVIALFQEGSPIAKLSWVELRELNKRLCEILFDEEGLKKLRKLQEIDDA